MPDVVSPIKCPQYGSAQFKLLEDRKYLCKSCGTTYFIGEEDAMQLMVKQLKSIKELLDAGILTQKEFDTKKNEILSKS